MAAIRSLGINGKFKIIGVALMKFRLRKKFNGVYAKPSFYISRSAAKGMIVTTSRVNTK